MTIVSEDLLNSLDDMIRTKSNDGWDLPPQLFVLTDEQKLGIVFIDRSFFKLYPNPTELFNALAELQREQLNEVKRTGQEYAEAFPEILEHGKVAAVIAVVESWGMEHLDYEQAIRKLPEQKARHLLSVHGYIPFADLPGAREQRNIVAVDANLNISMLIRYRNPEEVEYWAEEERTGIVRGPLHESLISFLGALLACYPPEVPK